MSEDIQQRLTELKEVIEKLSVELKAVIPNESELAAYLNFIDSKESILEKDGEFEFEDEKTIRLLDRYIERVHIEIKRVGIKDTEQYESSLNFLNHFPTGVYNSIYVV